MQDQLVRLILRVIMKYPQLQYYQVKSYMEDEKENISLLSLFFL